MNIGLLMVADENDVLERTLAANCEFVDCFYVIDGGDESARDICEAHPKCAGYMRDEDLDERFPPLTTCGYRQAPYEQARADHGADHWFLLLHGDEVWTGIPDLDTVYDGFIFRLPFYFPRAGEPWDDDTHPLDQLRWHFRPGYPEFRMFRGGDDINYDPAQHFNVCPSGIGRLGGCDHPILHYLYRSPERQLARAARHERTRFDPANYAHITRDQAVYWTDDMISGYQSQEFFRELVAA